MALGVALGKYCHVEEKSLTRSSSLSFCAMILPIKLCYIITVCSSTNEMIVLSKEVKTGEEQTKNPKPCSLNGAITGNKNENTENPSEVFNFKKKKLENGLRTSSTEILLITLF